MLTGLPTIHLRMRRTWRLPATERVIARPLRYTIATDVAALLPTRIASCLSTEIAMRLTAEVASIRATGNALATRSIAAGWPIECRAALTRTTPRGHR